MNKKYTKEWGALIVLLVLIAISYQSSRSTSTNTPPPSADPSPIVINEQIAGEEVTLRSRDAGRVQSIARIRSNDFVRGNPDAETLVIEYSDFECPFCSSVHQTLIDVVAESEGSIVWVYRHFPLVSIHRNATKAAVVSECVGEQKGSAAFWKYTDDVFLTGAFDIGSQSFVSDIAAHFNIKEQELERCSALREKEDYIASHSTEAQNAGLTGTPGFILVNRKTGYYDTLGGALPRELFLERINQLR